MSKLLGHAGRKYPWKRWEDGKKHTVTRGKHFELPAENFRKNLHTRANRIGRKVTATVKDEQTVEFMFL